MQKQSKKILVFLFDSVPTDSFIQQQLGIKSLFNLFLRQTYYFGTPSEWFPGADNPNYLFEFRSVTGPFREENLQNYTRHLKDHDNVILWPLCQWPKDPAECRKHLLDIIEKGSGCLIVGMENAWILNNASLPLLSSPPKVIESFNLVSNQSDLDISIFMSPSRSFNHLDMNNLTVTKTSQDTSKGMAEAKFLNLIPSNLQSYFPVLGGTFQNESFFAYKIPRFSMPDVSRLLIHNSLSKAEWHNFFNELKEYFGKVPKINASKDQVQSSLKSLFIDKLDRRLTTYQGHLHYSQVETMSLVLKKYLNREIEVFNQTDLFFSHGDLCFSNILMDHTHRGSLKFIDPRGCQTLEEAFLPLEYDFAKLSHCIYGKYDWILAKNLKADFQEDLHKDLAQEFEDLIESLGVNRKLIHLGEASLFLSMLPLHLDQPHLHAAMIQAAADAVKRYENMTHAR